MLQGCTDFRGPSTFLPLQVSSSLNIKSSSLGPRCVVLAQKENRLAE